MIFGTQAFFFVLLFVCWSAIWKHDNVDSCGQQPVWLLYSIYMPSEPSYQVGLDHLILQICFVINASIVLNIDFGPGLQVFKKTEHIFYSSNTEPKSAYHRNTCGNNKEVYIEIPFPIFHIPRGKAIPEQNNYEHKNKTIHKTVDKNAISYKTIPFGVFRSYTNEIFENISEWPIYIEVFVRFSRLFILEWFNAYFQNTI